MYQCSRIRWEDDPPSVEQTAAARDVLFVLELDPELKHFCQIDPFPLSSYLKWTIQGLFSCSTPPSPTIFSHLIP